MNLKPTTFWILAVVAAFSVVLVVAPITAAALDKLVGGVQDGFKVCLSCGDCEPKEAAACEKCGGTDFAVNWCDGCESVFEDDVKFTFCPNCGRKQ